MKKKKLIAATVAVLAAGNAVHAAVHTPQKKAVPALGGENVNLERARANISNAIRIKTVSRRGSGETDWGEFDRFHAFLDEAYPLIKEKLEKQVVPPANLIYFWKGSKPELDPIALCAHQDVVPVSSGTEQDWTHPAFDGVDDGEYIWGRGAMDMKNHLICVMEAVETLLEEGFQPERSVYLLFGDNEEIVASKENGAEMIMNTLKEKGVHLDAVLDEGGAMLPVNVKGVLQNKCIAGIGIAEKGYADIEISLKAKGGHSSQPPKHTALGQMAQVINDLESHQFKAKLTPSLKSLFDSIGRNCTYPVRLITCNLPILYPALLQICKQIPPVACMTRTTTGITMAKGSPAANVLPQKASITVNFRAMPGMQTNDLVDHIRRVVKNKNIDVNVITSQEPSAISPTDSRSYGVISRLCMGIEPNAIIAPYLVMGGTDARHYEPICKNIYRYSPFKVDTSLLLCTHGTNERLPVSAISDALVFFKNYIRDASDEE